MGYLSCIGLFSIGILFFALIFADEALIWDSMKLFKNDYLLKNYFDFGSWSFWLTLVSPFILTYLTIFVFPKHIIIPAFKQEELDETEKNIFKIRQQQRLVQAQTQLETENVKNITEVVKKVEEKQKIENIDPTLSWENEYKKLSGTRFNSSYLNFLNIFYSGEKYLSRFFSNDISYFDALGLIEIQSNEVKTLTPKGKFFALKVRGNNY